MSASRSQASSSSKAIGSSETLPLVITSVVAASAQQQVVERRVGKHHAELGGSRRHGSPTGASGRRRARTIGRARSRQQFALAGVQVNELARRAEVRRHQRERLVLAVLACAQLGHSGLVVRPAGEVEPTDALHRHYRAVEQRACGGLDGVPRTGILDRAPAAYASRTCGPQSWHAFGWAWKRRFAGSRYSARHAGHISNAAIVVFGRSYGTSRTMVKRGPQLVQLVNG